MTEQRAVELVLFDRDSTLVVDVPHNADPALVEPRPGAAEALHRLRCAGCRVGIVTTQSGVERGLMTRGDVDRVNERLDELLGPFDCIEVCPHTPFTECSCRSQGPDLVVRACRRLGVPVERCAVVSERPSDIGAALASGAMGVLVPSLLTRDLGEAVEGLLTGRWRVPT